MEITQRTIQGRYLLAPSTPRVNQIVVGCLARAQKHTDAKLHAVAVMSNHFHLLASFQSVEQMAGFMCHLKANLSKEIGKVHRWPGAMYAGRYTSIPVSDEPEAQLGRLRYLLAQGTKEGLVLSPRQWPGVSSADALTGDSKLEGLWIDRTAYHLARNRGEAVTLADVTEEEELVLEPLPALADLPVEARHDAVREMIEDIEQETLAAHRREGTSPAGADSVRRRHPHSRPKELARSIRPLFHAASKAARQALLEGYRRFLEAYRLAAERLKGGDLGATFPENCYPPGLPFVPPAVA